MELKELEEYDESFGGLLWCFRRSEMLNVGFMRSRIVWRVDGVLRVMMLVCRQL